MNIRAWSVAAVLALGSWAAQAQSPSAASVKELLEITRTRSMIDGALVRAEAQLREYPDKAPDGSALTPEQKAIIDRMRSRMMALYRGQLSWGKLEPEFIALYTRAYTQEEVDALVTFYRTPQGRSIVQKMPVVMSESMALVQRHVVQILPQMQKLQQSALSELAGNHGH